MAGRGRDAKLKITTHRIPDAVHSAIRSQSASPEEVSICDAVRRLLPGINPIALLESLQKEARNRRARIERLRWKIAAGEYHVEPGAIAAAILLEGDLLLQ